MKLINKLLKELYYLILGIISITLVLGFTYLARCLIGHISWMPTLKGAAVIIVVSWSYWILREIGQAFYGLITEIVYLRKNR